MEGLKSCPVCGNNDIDSWTYGEGSVPFVPVNVKDLTWGCEDDTCPYSLDNPITVEVWNKRTNDRLAEENAELREALEVSFKANDAFLSKGEMMDYDDFERIKQLLNK